MNDMLDKILKARIDLDYIIETLGADRSVPLADRSAPTTNGERNGRLSPGVVRSVRAAARKGEETQIAIAERFGIGAAVVSAIHCGRTYQPA